MQRGWGEEWKVEGARDKENSNAPVFCKHLHKLYLPELQRWVQGASYPQNALA